MSTSTVPPEPELNTPQVDAAGNRVTHGLLPFPLACPRCLHPIRVYRPTFGSLRWCEKCKARLGISEIRVFVTLKLMPDQFSGSKKFIGKKPTMTRAETLDAMRRNMKKKT